MIYFPQASFCHWLILCDFPEDACTTAGQTSRLFKINPSVAGSRPTAIQGWAGWTVSLVSTTWPPSGRTNQAASTAEPASSRPHPRPRGAEGKSPQLTSPPLLSAPNGPQAPLACGSKSPCPALRQHPHLGTPPREGSLRRRCAHGGRERARSGRRRAHARNPLRQGVPGGGQEATGRSAPGQPTCGGAGCRTGWARRGGRDALSGGRASGPPSGGQRLELQRRAGGEGHRSGSSCREGGGRARGSSPATAAAARPSSGSRRAGSAARGMTAARAPSCAPRKYRALRLPPTRPAAGGGGERPRGREGPAGDWPGRESPPARRPCEVSIVFETCPLNWNHFRLSKMLQEESEEFP